MKNTEREMIERVAAGYDVAGDAYFAYYRSSSSAVLAKYERLFVDGVRENGDVLELGCGNGLPLTASLAQRFRVTAADVSSGQVEKARKNVPAARVLQVDMTSVSFAPESFDGVIAFYSIIHVPKSLHSGLIDSIYAWLRPGGLFVGTFSHIEEDHREDDWFGAEMYWSSLNADATRRIVRAAGLQLESDRVETTDDPEKQGATETHLWIVARKTA